MLGHVSLAAAAQGQEPAREQGHCRDRSANAALEGHAGICSRRLRRMSPAGHECRCSAPMHCQQCTFQRGVWRPISLCNSAGTSHRTFLAAQPGHAALHRPGCKRRRTTGALHATQPLHRIRVLPYSNFQHPQASRQPALEPAARRFWRSAGGGRAGARGSGRHGATNTLQPLLERQRCSGGPAGGRPAQLDAAGPHAAAVEPRCACGWGGGGHCCNAAGRASHPLLKTT